MRLNRGRVVEPVAKPKPQEAETEADLMEQVWAIRDVERSGLNADDHPLIMKLAAENNLLGFYMSEHPMARFQHILVREMGVMLARDIEKTVPDQPVKICGMVKEFKVHYTKKREAMMFVKLEDMTGEIPVTVFPKSVRMFSSIFIVGNLVMVKGKASHRVADFSKKKKDPPPIPVAGSDDDEDAPIVPVASQQSDDEASNVSIEVVCDWADPVGIAGSPIGGTVIRRREAKTDADEDEDDGEGE